VLAAWYLMGYTILPTTIGGRVVMGGILTRLAS